MHQIVKAKLDLVRKAVNYSRGVSVKPDPDFFEPFEAAIADVAKDFLAEYGPKVIELRNLCRSATDDPHYLGLFCEMIRDLAYDIKGQAAMFGFELASEVASSLLDFVRNVTPNTTQHVSLVAAHADALYLLMSRAGSPANKEQSVAVVNSLHLASAQVRQRETGDPSDAGPPKSHASFPLPHPVIRPSVALFPDPIDKVTEVVAEPGRGGQMAD